MRELWLNSKEKILSGKWGTKKMEINISTCQTNLIYRLPFFVAGGTTDGLLPLNVESGFNNFLLSSSSFSLALG